MQPDATEEISIENARAHLEAGDYCSALTILDRLLSNRSSDMEASLLFAKAAEDNGDGQSAEEILCARLQTSPQDVRLLHALSRVYLGAGRLDEARAAAAQAAAAAPLDLETQRNLAEIVSAAGCVREALGRYGRLLTQFPGIPDPLLLAKTALLALQAGEEGLAGRVLAQAAAADPSLVVRLIRDEDFPGYLVRREEQVFASPLFPMLEEAVLACFLNLLLVMGGKPARRLGLIGISPRSPVRGLEPTPLSAIGEDSRPLSGFDLLVVCASSLQKEEELLARLRSRPGGTEIPVLRLSMAAYMATAAAQALNGRRRVDPVYSTDELALLALLTTLTPPGGCVLECGQAGRALFTLMGAFLREHPDFRQVFVLPGRAQSPSDLAALRANRLVGIVEYEYGTLPDGLQRLWKKNRKVSLAILHCKSSLDLAETLAEIGPRLERGGAVILKAVTNTLPPTEAGRIGDLLLRPLDNNTLIGWKDAGSCLSHLRGGAA